MSLEEAAAALVTTQLSHEQQVLALTSRGISEAEAEAALATAAKTATDTAATGATAGLSFATTGLTTALKGLWAAMMSNPITAIITVLLTLVTVVFRVTSAIKQNAEEAAQKARESAQQIKESYEEASTTIADNLKTLNGLKDEFDELSKGVDDYGNNISLTADQYERYKEIVQTILGISPELVAGYDDEGNAIANKNGLLEKSIALMEEEQRLKKAEIVSDDNLKTLFGGSEQEIKDAQKKFKDIQMPNDLAFSGVKYNNKGEKEYGYVNQIDKYVGDAIGIQFDSWKDGSIPEFIAKNIDDVYAHLDEILANAGKDWTDENGTKWAALSDLQVSSLKSYILSIKSSTDEIKEVSDNFNSYLQLIPESLSDYSSFDNSSKEFLSNWIRKSFDIDENTTEADIKEYADKIRDFTRKLANDVDLQNLIKTGADINNGKNSGDLTVKEYQDKVKEFLEDVNNLDDEDTKLYIKTSFGFDENDSDFAKDVSDKVNRVKNILKDEYDDKVQSLSMQDLQIAYEIEADTNSLTFEELEEKIANYKENLGKVSFDTYLENANKVISGVSEIQSLINSQATGASISVEDFNSEELADYTSALEYHNGVLQLNADKVRDIVSAKSEETIATNNANKALAQSKYLENAGQIEKLRQKIKDKNYAEGESEATIQANIDALLEENGTLKTECDTYDLITNSLQEATNAYNNWLNAQNASQSGDMFDDTIDAINRITETLNDTESEFFGRVGRTDYKAAIDLIIPESVDREDADKVNAYLKSVYDLFTYTEDGDYSGLNIENFCKKAVEKGLMVLDEASESYQIAGQKTMEDFADGMGLSLPLVQAMFGEMEEFGGEFSWADEANKTIGDLAVSANVAAENLRGLHQDLAINLDVSDLKTADEKSASLEGTIKQMKELKAKPGIDSSEIEYANSIISYCVTQLQQLENPAILDVDTTKVTEISKSAGEAVGLLQEFKTAYNNLELKKTLGVDTKDAQAEVDALLGKISSSNNDYLISLGLDTTSIETLNAAITGLDLPKIKATFNIDDTELKSYTPEDKKATVKYNIDTSKVDNYNPKNLSRTVTYYVRTVGTVNPSTGGTHRLNGSANAGGNWGVKQGGATLTGELGREIVVDPHTGRWYTVGDNGAEFVNIPKGSIVFNHMQTESLLKNGYVAGRASALVGGTAFVTGGIKTSGAKNSTTSGGSSTSNYGNTKSSSSSKSSSSKSSSSSSSDEKEPQEFDWIEVAIDRIERAIDRLKTTATSTYKALKTKLGATASEITKVNQELALQEQAYNRYIQQANSVGLSSGLASQVRNGTIDINEYDEDTKKLIDDYKQWYEKALDCSDAIQELHENLASLYEDDFNNIKDDFDNQLGLLEHLTNTYKTGQDKLEAKGRLESTKYVAALKNVEQQNIGVMNKELNSLIQSFSEAMASGEIEEYSESWYSMQQEINDVKEAIDEANLSLLEYDKTMREINWGYFDYMEDRISQITAESDFLIDLMSNSKMYDDNGQLTNEGLSTMGLHGVNYNVYMAQADDYAAEILKIDKEIANDPYNTDLIERREELLGLQQDSIKAAEDEKQAIVSLVEEGIKVELDNLKELIDTYTKSLDSAKSLYDYQKKVADKTKEIGNIEKQLAAYSNDTSEETRTKIQKLTVELQEKKEDLQETEYEQFISDTKKLLDELYIEYEQILNQRLDDVDQLISDMIDTVNANADTINSTITDTADSVGYTITSEMATIWDNAVNSLDGVIAKYDKDYGEQLTSVNGVLAGIQATVNSMVQESNKEAEKTVATTTTTTKPTTTTTPKTTTTTTTPKTTTPTRSDKDNYGVALAIINGNYGWGTGETRKKNLKTKGFNYDTVQGIVNKLMKEGYVNSGAWVGKYYGIKDLAPYHYNKYLHGGLIDYTGLAQVDGTPGNPELMLNSKDTKNFLELRDVLRAMSSQALTMGSVFNFDAPSLIGINDVSSRLATLKSGVGNYGTTVGDISITIPIEHIDDYNDFITQLQQDKQFEKLIQSMTIDRLAGGSPLAKNKFKW